MNKTKFQKIFAAITTSLFLIVSCSTSASAPNANATSGSDPSNDTSIVAVSPTPLPTRTTYTPGELVSYTAQTGDTLPALALRFNTTVDEILLANPQIPQDATTMPPGMPMKIPIYYLALWASPFQIIPDHAFVDGPTNTGFNAAAFVE